MLDVWSGEGKAQPWLRWWLILWFMCVLCALRPCKFISTGPVQQHDLLLFSMSPHNNKVSQTWCLTLIYDPSHKLKIWCLLGLWKRKVSVTQTSGINNWWLLHQSDSDLPLRVLTQLPKLFIREARFLKRVWTKNTFEEKCCSQFNSVWFRHLLMAFCLIHIFPPQASVLLVGLRRPLCAWHHMPPDANLWLFLLFIICVA